jgi:hypothetical protein
MLMCDVDVPAQGSQSVSRREPNSDVDSLAFCNASGLLRRSQDASEGQRSPNREIEHDVDEHINRFASKAPDVCGFASRTIEGMAGDSSTGAAELATGTAGGGNIRTRSVRTPMSGGSVVAFHARLSYDSAFDDTFKPGHPSCPPQDLRQSSGERQAA